METQEYSRNMIETYLPGSLQSSITFLPYASGSLFGVPIRLLVMSPTCWTLPANGLPGVQAGTHPVLQPLGSPLELQVPLVHLKMKVYGNRFHTLMNLSWEGIIGN